MIQYKTTVNDQDYREQVALLDGVIIGSIITHKAPFTAVGSRWKGSLKVTSYEVYTYLNNDQATFRPSDYDSARQALTYAKRYMKASSL